MKIARKGEKKEKAPGGFSSPAVNSVRSSGFVVALIILAVLAIVWVWTIGKKAEETVRVAMWSQNVYKNQVVTSEMLEPYDMLLGEYEKLSIVKSNSGAQTRRVVLWDEAKSIIGGFAAYPLQAGTYVEYRTLVKSRIDNSDSVLYSFPGRDIVELDVDSSELKVYKTFIQPGDRLNITAIYSDEVGIQTDDGYGNTITEQKTVFRSETVFNDLVVADMLNNSGESILDIYAEYNDMTVWQQVQMQQDPTFNERTEPASLIVALTPEEQDRYYYYLSKDNVELRLSMPQRMD